MSVEFFRPEIIKLIHEHFDFFFVSSFCPIKHELQWCLNVSLAVPANQVVHKGSECPCVMVFSSRFPPFRRRFRVKIVFATANENAAEAYFFVIWRALAN